jgi:hypothetical protein
MWHPVQWQTVPAHAHAHTWQQRVARGCPDKLVGTLLGPGIAAQRRHSGGSGSVRR